MEILRRALAALERQTLPGAEWELILVDNRSDNALADAFDWEDRADWRVVREDELGLTHARLRGLREARSDLVIYVDDDNFLAPDYLEKCVEIAAERPFIGAFGGNVVPEFEVDPPAYSAPHLHLLALRETGRELWTNDPSNRSCMPCGAGMAVRRVVAEAYAKACATDKLRRQLDRKGKSLFSAGDTDLALTATDCGLGFGLFPQLRLSHYIPKGRLERDYLLRLGEGVAYSDVFLQRARTGALPRDTGVRKAKQVIKALPKGAFETKMTLRMQAGVEKAKQQLKEIEGTLHN